MGFYFFFNFLELTDMLPTIMQQLGAENMWNIKNLANSLNLQEKAAEAADDDVPELVENFDEVFFLFS